MADIIDASGYNVEEISIVTKAGTVIDIRDIIEELNIFDSIFLPSMSGNILVTDAMGLSSAVKFDGSEVLLLSLSKFDWFTQGTIKKAFRIYSQTNRRNISLTAERYVLHFVSEEYFLSKQHTVYDSMDATYSSFAEKIVKKYLKVGDESYLSDQSIGFRTIRIPGLSPLNAAEWCAKRAVDINGSPNYLFFANKLGYNFYSLSTLLQKDEILHISISPKNMQNDSIVEEMYSAKAFQVVTQTDSLERIIKGVNAGTYYGFDPITRSFNKSGPTNQVGKDITFSDFYDKINRTEENFTVPNITNIDNSTTMTNYRSKISLGLDHSSRKESQYIKKNDPGAVNKIENYEEVIFQRKALFANLLQQKIKVVVPGNFNLTSGFSVYLTVPTLGGNRGLDADLTGKYLISATRHTLSNRVHSTILELVSDSVEVPRALVNSPSQTDAIDNYEGS